MAIVAEMSKQHCTVTSRNERKEMDGTIIASCHQFVRHISRLVFTSDGVVIRSAERYDLVKIRVSGSEAEY